MKVNGIALKDFQIVYPEHSDGGYEKFLAQQLANELEVAWGFLVVLKSDEEAPAAHEILVGNTNRDVSGFAGELGFDDFSVSSDGNHVVLTSKVYKGLGEAVNKFLSMVRGGEEVCIPLNNVMPCETYSAMSFNILCGCGNVALWQR